MSGRVFSATTAAELSRFSRIAVRGDRIIIAPTLTGIAPVSPLIPAPVGEAQPTPPVIAVSPPPPPAVVISPPPVVVIDPPAPPLVTVTPPPPPVVVVSPSPPVVVTPPPPVVVIPPPVVVAPPVPPPAPPPVSVVETPPVVIGPVPSGRTFNVANGADLVRIAKTAVGGDTILLAPGHYGNVHFNSINPNGNVTIRSANPDADAVFKTLKFSSASNFTFEDIDVHNPLAPGEPDFIVAVRLNSSRNITFVGMDVYGSLNGNPNDDGNGLLAQNSQRIAVLDSTFRELNVTAAFPTTNDIVFAGNSVSTVREGLNIPQVDGALIERNFFTRILPDVSRNDHADAIQIHAGGTYDSSRNLLIRSNVMLLGDSESQGIFIRNEKARLGFRHENIQVEDNYYEGNSRHGITVADTDNIEVTGNTVRDRGTLGLVPGINITNIRGGLVEDNIATMLIPSATSPNRDVIWRDNIDVWDRKQLSGVADASLFSTRVGSGEMDFSAYEVRPGSLAATIGAGFVAVTEIGNFSVGTAALLAAYLPQFDAFSPQVAIL